MEKIIKRILFMKKDFFVIPLIFFVSISTAQNLVLNPSLEDLITCPGFGQFDSIYVSHWTKPSWGSTDYYHDSCAGIEPVSQAPNGGSAYFGIIAYNYGTEYREYATGRLSSPLDTGAVYVVKFYVSLNDGYIQAVNEMGAFLSAEAPGPYANSLHIPVTPQIQNTSGVLSSITSWMLVSGIYTAAGGEQYITIGNFNDDPSTTITQVGNIGSYGAYYFVDDVSVVKGKGTGMSSDVPQQLSIVPNPSHGIFRFSMRDEAHKGSNTWTVLDCSGRKIISGKMEKINDLFTAAVDLSPFSEGIYFLQFKSEHEVITRKLVKN